MRSRGPPEQQRQRGLRCAREVADSRDAPAVQASCSRRPDAPDALDRQRVQERELALGRHDEEPVRFRDSARDLGQELRPRDADGDGDADLLAHAPAEPHGDLARRAREALHAAHVEERLVDRDSLDERGRVLEDREERLARSRVLRHARRHDERLGQRRSACLPPIAVRTPYAFAS